MSAEDRFEDERDRRYQERFDAQQRETDRWAAELARRLDELNHAHAQAREKEREFIARETFETSSLRTADDMAVLRREIQMVANTASAVREAAAQELAKSRLEQNQTNDARFSRLENMQAKMLGGLVLCSFVAPLVTGLLVYALTRK